MFTVAEAARLVGVSSGTLRLWETQGLVAPVRGASGHRAYREADIERLRKIAWWRRVRGLNAAAIRRVLDDEDYASLADTPPASQVVPTTSLRTRRRQAGLTLRQLSDRSGLSVSFLSAVERGVSNPSPTASARLNAALADSGAVDLQADLRVHSLGSGKRVDVAPGITYEWLSNHTGLLEPQLVTIQPGGHSEGTYQHDGEEFLIVLAGAFEIALNGSTDVLAPRDSIHFDSQVSHSWGNAGMTEAEVLWITTERGVWAGATPSEHSRTARPSGHASTARSGNRASTAAARKANRAKS